MLVYFQVVNLLNHIRPKTFSKKNKLHSARLQPDMLDASAISTAGLVYFLFDMAEHARTPGKSDFALGFLERISQDGMNLLRHAGGHCYMENGTLAFAPPGLCNIDSSLTCHRSMKDSLQATWNDLKEAGKISTDFRAATLVDITVFLAIARRHRRQHNKHSWSAGITQVHRQMFWSVVNFLAASIRFHCRHLQANVENIAGRAIPSRKKKQFAHDFWFFLIGKFCLFANL